MFNKVQKLIRENNKRNGPKATKTMAEVTELKSSQKAAG